MGIFKDVTLTWQGDEYTVPSNKVMQLIAKIEDCVTLQELVQEGGPKMTHLAEAYKIALNDAGCKVDSEQIYGSMFGEKGQEGVAVAVSGLLMMMVPPDAYQPDLGKPTASPTKKRKKKA
jgi:hypothetical protein